MDNQTLKTKTISGMFWKMSEQIGKQLVRMLTMIILARILMPEDYGAIALVTVFVSICDVVLTSGLSTPLIQKKDADSLDFSTIFFSSIVLAILMYVLIYVSAPYISVFYDMDILCPVLRVLGLGIIICAASSVQNAYVSRLMKFRTFFFSSLIGLILSGVIGIYMAYQGFGIWALVGQSLSNQIINLIVVFVFIRWTPKWEFSWSRLSGMWSYGWKVFVGSLINQIFTDLRTILVGKFYSKEELAFFNQGSAYPHMIVSNVNTTITAVLFPAISIIQDDLTSVKIFLRRSIKISSFFLFPLLLGFAATAEPLVSVLLTDKWLPSVPFIQVMCFSLCLASISTPSMQAIKAVGRSDITLKQEIIKKSVFLLIILITAFISVWAVVIGSAIGEIWCAIVNAYPNKKLFNYSFRDQIMDILPNGLCALFMAVIVYMISFINLPLILELIIQVIVGGVIYVGIAKLTKNESYIYCKENLNFFKKR